MRRSAVHEFFRLSPASDAVLAERRRWLDHDPAAYVACLPEGQTAAGEAADLLEGSGVARVPAGLGRSGSGRLLLAELGRQLEPDLVLLLPNHGGEFYMVGGAVCFPSSWSLEEKMGRPLTAIHAPVPGLNEQLGVSISRFLHRMVPGVAWCRENWGLSACHELNHHPARGLPRMDSRINREAVWLRVERQALVALPKSGAVLFGIRVELFPMSEVASYEECRAGLIRALRTMSTELAEYKGLASARERLIQLLE